MSSANIFGLAILENPRQESGAPASGKGVVFDAQFYLGPGEVAVGCLRYFNDADIAFDEGGTYFVCTTVAKILPGAETHSTLASLSADEYQFVGDIQWLIPADVEDQRHRPYVVIAGTAKNINETDATFEIDAFQYTSALKNLADPKLQKSKSGNQQSNFPLRARIPDTKRFKTKPLPKPNSNVLVSGFLTQVDLSKGKEVNRFLISMENITFLGRSLLPASSTPEPVQTPDTGSKRKLKYSFDSPSPLRMKRVKLENIKNQPSAEPPNSSPHN